MEEILQKYQNKDVLTFSADSFIKELIQARDKLSKSGNLRMAQNCQFEVDFFSLHFEEGSPIGHFSFVKDGKEQVYPSISEFNEAQLSYLENRINEAINPIFLAQYSNIAWHSSRKHHKYIKLAVDSESEIIHAFLSSDNVKSNAAIYKLTSRIENAFHLAKKTNYRFDEIKNHISAFYSTIETNRSLFQGFAFGMGTFIFKNRKKFPENLLEAIIDQCYNFGVELSDTEIYNSLKLFELGKGFEEKQSSSKYFWDDKIAFCWEEMGKSRNDFVGVEFLRKAHLIYKKLESNEKILELEELIRKVRKKTELGTVEFKVEVTDLIKDYDLESDKISDLEPKKILSYLVNSPSLFPTVSSLEESAEVHLNNSPIRKYVTQKVFDNKGNTAESFSGEVGAKKSIMLENYSNALRISFYLLKAIVQKSYLKRKFSLNHILAFLSEGSWLGTVLKFKIREDKFETRRWLDFLTPTLSEIFYQLQFIYTYPDYRPSFVLPIDSGTLKFEGIIRDMCKLIGVETSFSKSDGNNGIITQERDLNSLLWEPKLEEIIDVNDLFFFRFLFCEKGGYNIRNEIAHSLFPIESYSEFVAYLVLLAILKIGKYNIKNEKDA